MGLSRNKVAVSEGAAGSPPFYGEHDAFSRMHRIRGRVRQKTTSEFSRLYGPLVVQFSVTDGQLNTLSWGCSSAGRAPALQAGGHGFDSHHLHQATGCGGQARVTKVRIARISREGLMRREANKMETKLLITTMAHSSGG